jgi:hypothetical protein
MATVRGRTLSLLLLTSVVTAALALACKNVDEPATPAAISGTWLYHESMVDNLYGASCADTGTYALTQNGPRFTGTFVQSGICRNGNVAVFNTGHGPVTDGVVTNIKVQFTAGTLCAYTGLLSQSHASVDAGTGLCAFVDSASGEHYNLIVSWDMVKQ